MKTISLENVSFSYDRNNTLKNQCLKSISFSISQGNILGIFGPSGAGKTTLIYLICGLLKPDYGKILVDGHNPWEQKIIWEKLRIRMGVAFQFPEDMFFQESISEEFWKILGEKGHSKKDVEQLSHNAMKWIGLDANYLWSKHPFRLSQGQLRRLSLALVWAQDWDLLLMDESTVGLDCLLKGKILKDLLHRCHQQEKLCIVTGHDTSTLLPLVDYGIVLDKGEIVLYDTREKILQQSELLSSVGLSIPPLADLSIKLKKNGLPINQIWNDQGQAIRDLTEII